MPIQINSCLIWGKEYGASGVFFEENRTYRVDTSPRAGGSYIADAVTWRSSVVELSAEQKARLTTWIVEQNSQAAGPARVTEETVRHILSRRPLQVNERAYRLLKFMTQRSPNTN